MKYSKENFGNPVLRFLKHMFFPNRCIFCADCVNVNEYSCSKCDIQVKNSLVDFCPVCGNVDCICENNTSLDYVKSIFIHEDLPRKAVLSLKFYDNVSAAKSIAIIMHDKLTKEALFDSFNLIIPIPSSKKKLKKRGYNQALLIAKSLSELSEKALSDGVLIKVKETEYQHELNASERLSNLDNAFDVADKNLIMGKDILLIDDVYTTGATMRECANTLLSQGAASVKAMTFTCGDLLD